MHIYIARWYVLNWIEDNARLRPVEPALVTRKKSSISSILIFRCLLKIRLLLHIKEKF